MKTSTVAALIVAGVALAMLGTAVMASRNASGTYSLPAGNPVVTGTKISSTWANNTFGDVGTEITNSLDRGGRGAMTAPLQLVDGTVALPGIAFASNTNTGLYRIGAGNPAMAAGGVKAESWTSTGVAFPVGLTATQTAVNGTATTTTGNGTGHGIDAVGGSSSGIAGSFTGGAPNGLAINALGTGSGGGVTATGGATSGVGAAMTGGAPNGHGATGNGTGTGYGLVGTGGASNGIGVVGQGTAGGSGVDATGGGTSGTGVHGVGGAGNGIGGDFTGGGSGVAVRTNGGGLQIGTSGTAISASYGASYTIDFPNIAATATCSVSAQTLNGVSVGGVCNVSPDAELGGGGHASVAVDCYVTGANAVSIRLCNNTGGAWDQGSGAFRVRVFQP